MTSLSGETDDGVVRDMYSDLVNSIGGRPAKETIEISSSEDESPRKGKHRQAACRNNDV